MASRNQITASFWQIANATTDGDVTGIIVQNANLGAVGNVKITGGTNGQFLQTDGAGNLTFANASGGGGSGNPGGANTQIQFNDGSAFGGIPTFTYNKTTGTVSFTAANVSLGTVGNLHIGGGTTGQILSTDGSGTLSWISVGAASYSNSNVQSYLASNANVVFTTTGNITTTASIKTANLTANGSVVLGSNSNVQITGGTVGQVLTTDGAGGLSWSTPTGGGGSSSNITFGTEQVALLPSQFSATYNFDVSTNAIKYATGAATQNVTLNFRGNGSATFSSICPTGNSITCSYVMTTGSTPYLVNAVQIDGVSYTIKWVGGSTPIASANSILTHTFTLIKTSATPTYTVLGSMTRYA